jgi:hypothetical protein
LIVVGAERRESVIHQISDPRAHRRQENLANADVVNQHSTVVDHVEHIERLGILTVLADVVEDLVNQPFAPDGHVVRCHQPAHRVGRVGEQPFGLRSLLGGEKCQQLVRRMRRQCAQEQGAVVRRHVVEHERHIVRGHHGEQRPLRGARQVLEHRRSGACRQGPKHAAWSAAGS